MLVVVLLGKMFNIFFFFYRMSFFIKCEIPTVIKSELKINKKSKLLVSIQTHDQTPFFITVGIPNCDNFFLLKSENKRNALNRVDSTIMNNLDEGIVCYERYIM